MPLWVRTTPFYALRIRLCLLHVIRIRSRLNKGSNRKSESNLRQ